MKTTIELGQYLHSQFVAAATRFPKQLNLAAAWVAGWTAEKYKDITIESRISELFNGKADGIKFFFSDLARAKLLFDLLEISSAGRLECMKIADAALSDRVDPRIAVDLRGLDGETFKAACIWIEQELLAEGRRTLLPAQLIVTPRQHDEIPRRFDKYRDGKQLMWSEEPDPTSGKPLTSPTATMLLAPSPRAMAADGTNWPWVRWVQLQGQGGRILLDPTDGLDRLSQDGAVGDPTTNGRKLSEMHVSADAASAEAWLARAKGPWRRVVETLVSAEAVGTRNETQSVRAGLAELFGLTALATAAEVADYEIGLLLSKLGLQTAEAWTQAQLDKYLARAATHPVAPLAVRVGDQLHAVNLKVPKKAMTDKRLLVHEVVCAEPAIDAIKSRLAQLSPADLDDDPGLEQLLADLCAAGHNETALHHGRAALFVATEQWLRLASLLSPKAPPASVNWREVILSVTGNQFSPVELRVGPWKDRTIAVTKPAGLLAVPAAGATSVGREIATAGLHVWRSTEVRSHYDEKASLPPEWSRFKDLRIEGGAWLDAFDAWQSDNQKDHWGNKRSRVGPGTFVDGGNDVTAEVDWQGIDALCAMLLARLRRVAENGDAGEIGTGRYILPIGAGIAAELTISNRQKKLDGLRIRVAGRFQERGPAQVAWRIVETVHGDAVCGLRLPSQVIIDAGQLRLELTFHADPFSAPNSARLGAMVGAVNVEKARQAAEEQLALQLAMDDDD